MNYKIIIVSLCSFLLLRMNTINAQNSERPNIVWIVSEDNSKHYLQLFDSNGVATPNIELLAQQGITFHRAFSNTPVCSAARSTIITSCYGPRLASHYHRRLQECPVPEGLEMFPALLRAAGYYTTNCSKEDYNLQKSNGVWDESSKKAHWQNRAERQPFFHVHNIMTSHEYRMHFTEETYKTTKTKVNPDSCFVQPNHPQTDLFKYSNAHYRDAIQEMDEEVGEVVEELRKDGLLESTFIFYYSDHGGVLPGSKGYLSEMGLAVPLVVRIPESFQHLVDFSPGATTNGFVNFVDLGPSVLNLAGVPIPDYVDGSPFLGSDLKAKALSKRNVTYGYANRFDEKYDMVRSLRIGKYKYVRNYTPFNIDGLRNNYRYKQLAYQEWKTLFENKELNEHQAAFFNLKSTEALYNVEEDPYELNNLAKEPKHAKLLVKLREQLIDWQESQPDLSFFPEFYILNEGCNNLLQFGQENKSKIAEYIKVSNLIFEDYNKVKQDITHALNSHDPWMRYWGLIVCSSFKEQATEQKSEAVEIAKNDPILINRVRASEFLALAFNQSPVDNIQNALFQCSDPKEALLILNSVVLLRDHYYKYEFSIQVDKLQAQVRDDKMVQRRLEYLGVIASN